MIFKRHAAPDKTEANSIRGRRSAGLFSRNGRAWLLLRHDINGTYAAIATDHGADFHISAQVASANTGLDAALKEILSLFAQAGHKPPRRVALASRLIQPLTANLPIPPDKPRPAAQMRELLRNDLESALAEFGSLWSLGALLQTRAHLSPADRDRVLIEESARRESRRAPLRYGETALELGLIERADLQECLELQEQLQFLDSQITSAWLGRLENREPLWLACGVSQNVYQRWQQEIEAHGLRLELALPLAWLLSETEPATPEPEDAASLISLEFLHEDVRAVRRRAGRILATRSEGRMERPLQADWLARLLDEWSDESRARIELVCPLPDDEARTPAIAEDLHLITGLETTLRSTAQCERMFWHSLMREAGASRDEIRLPRLAPRELAGSPWKNRDLQRVMVAAAVLLLLIGIEGVQRVRLHRLEARMAETFRKETESQNSTKLTLQVGNEMKELGRRLDEARSALQPVLADHDRLQTIVSMRQHLPELLLGLAQTVQGDAVLERVSNTRMSQDATAIRVEAWSADYTGAQAFVNRVAERVRAQHYGVVQTEIVEARGRTGQKGHRVGFWLVVEGDELEMPSAAVSATVKEGP